MEENLGRDRNEQRSSTSCRVWRTSPIVCLFFLRDHPIFVVDFFISFYFIFLFGHSFVCVRVRETSKPVHGITLRDTDNDSSERIQLRRIRAVMPAIHGIVWRKLARDSTQVLQVGAARSTLKTGGDTRRLSRRAPSIWPAFLRLSSLLL